MAASRSTLLAKVKRKSKVPAKLPTWLVKCVWDATAVTLKVEARDEADAWTRALKRVARIEGGDSCLKIIVKGRV